MFYVPYVPPHPPSPRTRELADLLARAIAEYEKYHPDVSGQEVRDALRLAARSSGKAGPDARPIAVGATLAALLVGFLLVAMQRGGPESTGVPYVALSVAVFAGVFMTALLVRRGGR